MDMQHRGMELQENDLKKLQSGIKRHTEIDRGAERNFSRGRKEMAFLSRSSLNSLNFFFYSR